MKNKTVFITGATSGIGLATARVFAAHQCDLILSARREDRLSKIKSELETNHGIHVRTLSFDVRDQKACATAINPIAHQVDILINNAGLARGLSPIHEGDLTHWEDMIDTNIKGLLFMTRLISPKMVERQSGHIINICSTAGKEVYPNGNVYCATKFAVEALTKALRLDLYKHGIRVSQVSPAHVEETEFALWAIVRGVSFRFLRRPGKSKNLQRLQPTQIFRCGRSYLFYGIAPTSCQCAGYSDDGYATGRKHLY